MSDPIVTGQSALSTPSPAAVSPDSSLAAPTSQAATEPTLTAAPSWFDELPDGLKANPTLANFKGKSVKDVAESLINAQSLVGGSLRLPTDKDTPAERAAKLDKVFTQLGRPEKADGYKVEKPADLDIPWDEGKVTAFKEVAHKLGLTQAQVDGLSAFDMQRAMGSQVDSTVAFNDCMTTLEKDWGAAKPQMLGLARRTASTYFDKDTMASLDAAGVTNNPAFIKALASMGKELMEEGLIVGAREGMSEDGGVVSMQAEIDKVMNDSKSAYWDSTNPGHEAAVIRLESLRRALLQLSPTAG